MKKKVVWLLIILLFGSRLAVTHAQTELYPGPFPMTVTPTQFEPYPGPFPVQPNWNMDGLRIEYQRVDVSIEEQVATTHIEQLFVNENDWMLEGTYLFPLPEGAAVSQLTMWVDGQPIEAKILEKDEARKIYDTIVRQLRDPALLEYVGSSAIQANVFPIPPRDERRIEIEYSMILPAENGLIHFLYPQSTNLYTNTPLDEQSVRIEVASKEALHAIYSPSHAVDIFRDGEFRAVAGYEAQDVTPDQDFELYYTVSPEDIGLNLLSFRETGQDGFFTLLVAPNVVVDEIVAKDILLVIDTSGSMEGEKMQQAKVAAEYVVDHLNPEDRFNIISFSTGIRSFAPQLVSQGEADNYQAYINSLEAIGGTNISTALLEAAGMVDGKRPSTIIFLTDGLPTEGIVESGLLLNAVGNAMPTNARIFAFGVGDDLDPNLLDALAQNHRGTTIYVRPGQSINEEVSSFYAKVSTPVLSNISLDFDGVVVEQLYPQTLPDLFAGTQMVLTGRYREGGPATIRLSGDVNGTTQSFIYEDNLFRTSGGEDFIPRLWATRAIGHLLREIRLHGEDRELVQSVINLSTRYGIITPYTSYLIEEDDIFAQTARGGVTEEVIVIEGEPVEVTRIVTESVMVEVPAEEAAAVADMAEAEVASSVKSMPSNGGGTVEGDGFTVSSEQMVQIVGNKTFILRHGVWMDTAFDADSQTPQTVGFASDNYFDLLSAAPEVGEYLAVGPQVLFVHDGVAYEVVEGDGQAELLLPETIGVGESDAGDGNGATAVSSSTSTSPSINWLVILAGFAAGALIIPIAIRMIVGSKKA